MKAGIPAVHQEPHINKRAHRSPTSRHADFGAAQWAHKHKAYTLQEQDSGLPRELQSMPGYIEASTARSTLLSSAHITPPEPSCYGHCDSPHLGHSTELTSLLSTGLFYNNLRLPASRIPGSDSGNLP